MNRVKFSPLFLCEESWRGFWDWSYRWSWPKKVGVESLLSMELLNEILLCWITMLKVDIKFNWLKSSNQNSHELNKFNKTKITLIKPLPSRTSRKKSRTPEKPLTPLWLSTSGSASTIRYHSSQRVLFVANDANRFMWSVIRAHLRDLFFVGWG